MHFYVINWRWSWTSQHQRCRFEIISKSQLAQSQDLSQTELERATSHLFIFRNQNKLGFLPRRLLSIGKFMHCSSTTMPDSDEPLISKRLSKHVFRFVYGRLALMIRETKQVGRRITRRLSDHLWVNVTQYTDWWPRHSPDTLTCTHEMVRATPFVVRLGNAQSLEVHLCP